MVIVPGRRSSSSKLLSPHNQVCELGMPTYWSGCCKRCSTFVTQNTSTTTTLYSLCMYVLVCVCVLAPAPVLVVGGVLECSPACACACVCQSVARSCVHVSLHVSLHVCVVWIMCASYELLVCACVRNNKHLVKQRHRLKTE